MGVVAVFIMEKMIAKRLNSEVNWISFFSMVRSLGKQLNDRQLRFLKARLIESSLAHMSTCLKWIDDIGCDHIMDDNIRIETKFMTNGLTTASGEFKKTGRTSEIKLTNTLGSSENRSLPHTFDYLLIVDVDCAAIVSYENLLPYVKSNGDGLKASVPYDKIEVVRKIEPSELFDGVKISVLQQVDDMLYNIANSYKNVLTTC